MKSFLPIILVVLVTLSTVFAQSNRTTSSARKELSFWSARNNPAKLSEGPKGPCVSNEECREKLHHEAYCVEDRCACSVGTAFIIKNGEPRCQPWVCEEDDDCKFAEGDLETHEKCLHNLCGCPEGWHADEWRCTEDEKDKKKKKKKN